MGEYMPRIDAQGIKSFEAQPGRRLVLEIEDHGIDILHRCGGFARCTTCRVEIIDGDPGPMNEREEERLGRIDDLPANTRLSCQILCAHDLTIRVINRLSETELADPGPRVLEDVDAEA
jgi:ferredoxin